MVEPSSLGSQRNTLLVHGDRPVVDRLHLLDDAVGVPAVPEPVAVAMSRSTLALKPLNPPRNTPWMLHVDDRRLGGGTTGDGCHQLTCGVVDRRRGRFAAHPIVDVAVPLVLRLADAGAYALRKSGAEHTRYGATWSR